MEKIKKIMGQIKKIIEWLSLSYLIICGSVIISVALIIIGAYTHRTTRQELQERTAQIETLLEGFSEIRAIAEADQYDFIQIYITDPDAVPYTLADAMSLLQSQYHSFTEQISALIALFTIAFTIFSIAMPIMNYVFVQKDVIVSLREKQDEMKEAFEKVYASSILEQKKMKEEFEAASTASREKHTELQNNYDNLLSELEGILKEQKEIKSTLDTEIPRLEGVIKQAGQMSERVASTVSHKLDEHSLRTSQIDIEPISDSDADKAKALYLNAMTGIRPELALTHMKKAVELAPDNAQYRNGLAGILHDMKLYHEALAEIQKAVELEPNNATYRDNLGGTLHEMNRLQEALVESHKAVELEPNNAQYRDNLGITLHNMKRYPEALAEHEKAVELDPKDGHCIASLGRARYKLKRYSTALESLDKALSMSPNQDRAYRYRGLTKIALEQMKDTPNYEDAMQDLDKAIELGKDGNSSHYNYLARAEAYITIGEYDKAKKDLTNALLIDDKEPETYYWFSVYYKKTNNPAKSSEYLAKAYELGYIPEP